MATMGHAVDTAAERRMLLLGVRLFILSEVMLFGAFFTAYFVLRAQAPAWPPLPDLERPELPLVGFNTLLLLSSSVTMQWAVTRIGRGDAAGFRRGLLATLVLGAVFLAIQGYEFASNGFGISDGVFGSTFYTLTSFHGAHVLGGLLLMGVLANRARLGLVTREHHTAVEGVSYYWHFVDVVWVVLFLTVYVL
jgi:cytochrome c oxidase subunit 3